MSYPTTERWSQQLRETLLGCESPFTWDMPEIDNSLMDHYITSQLEKCDNIEEENDFKWTRFNLHLLLSYELWHQLGDIVSATHHVNSCCKELEELTDNFCSEQLFASIKGVLWHVTLATKAHLLLANHNPSLAAQIMGEIRPVHLMSREEQAGLWGIKAAVLKQYHTEGHKLALEMATRATTMDPNQAEWHFIVANCLGRLRRADRSPITQREVNEMEHAFSLQKDATYTSHLAQMFVDYSVYVYCNRNNTSVCPSAAEALKISQNYGKKAVERFKEAIWLRPHCPGLKVRVAHGLLRIPDLSWLDISLAKRLLDEASVHMPNNSMLHYDLGFYYHKLEKDPERAIESLKRSHELGNYPAFLYLVYLWWRYSEETDLIEEITTALTQYTSAANTAELLVHLGAAHMLLHDDWASAVHCFNCSLELDSCAKYMKRFRGFFWKGSKNLLDIVSSGIHIKMEQAINLDVFKTFLLKTNQIGNNLIKTPETPDIFTRFKETQMASKFKRLMI